MNKILVFGDSNTWGDNFLTRRRIPDDKQWCNILQEKLGKDYKVYQEGLPGRFAGSVDKNDIYKNGIDTFLSTYKSIAPIDTLIISLGSNDLRPENNRTSDDIIKDLLSYKELLEKEFNEDNNRYFNGKLPEIIYVLPINFALPDSKLIKIFQEIEIKRQNILKYFNDNNIKNIYFNHIDLCEDGLHMSIEGHNAMANTVYDKIINNNL